MLKRIFAASLLFFALSLSSFVHATSAQDTWWDPNESGWGINVIQEGSTLGFAMYVFDGNSNPVWYIGSGSGSIQNGFNGSMFFNRGPYFGSFFNPNFVSATQVGNFSFRLTSVSFATLTYTINGVQVSKNLQRFSAVGNANLAGEYIGGLASEIYNCSNFAPSRSSAGAVTLSVTHNGSNVSMFARAPDSSSCTYSGTYSQTGRYGNVAGNFTCSDSTVGTFTMFEIDTNSQGLTGRFTADASAFGVTCLQRGRLGGINSSLTGF